MIPLWVEKNKDDAFFLHVNKVGYEQAAKDLKVTVGEVIYKFYLLRYKYDSEYFAAQTLRISDKNGAIVPLIYNNGQRKICAAKERQVRAGKPVRVALLKARQFGGSTLEEGDVFRECLLGEGRSTMIIAHDLDSARHLREMSARYYEYYSLPKPKLKKETDKWWKFQHYRDRKSFASNLRIDTAEELSTGHSLTLHHLHLSEIQNWRNATVLVKGLFPTVPNNPDTTIFMEGTGSGVGDYWYDFCQMAQDSSTGWEFVFVGWHEIEDYTLKFDNEDKRGDFEAKLGEEERILLKSGVSLEQLHWRRMQIDEIYKGDDDAFRQQYPFDADEAFLTSGRPVFKQIKVKEATILCKKGERVGNLVEKRLASNDKIITFEDDRRGLWEIWEEPVLGIENLYCAGVDVATGIAVVPELGNRGGDCSAIKIFRRDKRKFVARLNAQIDPDLVSEELRKASTFWKGLEILVENNEGGSGNVVIRDLKELPEIRLLKMITLDRVHDTRKSQFGWDTNKESKRELIDELAEQIREERFSDRDKDFWYQASTYVRDEKGRTNAQSRKFDDLVIAEALCLQADKLLPMVFNPTKKDEPVITADMDIPYNWRKRTPTPTQAQVMEDNLI